MHLSASADRFSRIGTPRSMTLRLAMGCDTLPYHPVTASEEDVPKEPQGAVIQNKNH
jgi:hypothetical protein